MLCKKPFKAGTMSFGCGQCLPCRINRQRLWAHRITLESKLHEHSSFVTLTYSDQFLPSSGSLVPKHATDWLKRFRFRFAPTKFRYYLVGEYGDLSGRPHYHVALFGYPSCPYYSSVASRRISCVCDICRPITETWGFGRCTVDPLEYGSAQYIAGYVTKKMTRKDDPRLNGRHPEFARMSRKPGIGYGSIEYVSQIIEEYGDLALQEGDVPLSLQHGKKKLPLGRYLRTKLREELGLEDQKELSLQKFKEEQYAKAVQLQEDCKTPKEYEEALRRLKERDAQIILNIERKFQLFKKIGDVSET